MNNPKRISLAQGILPTTKGVLFTCPVPGTAEVLNIKISHLDKAGADVDVTLYKKDAITSVESVISGKDITYGPGYFSEDDTNIVMNAGDTISGVASTANMMQYIIEGYIFPATPGQ